MKCRLIFCLILTLVFLKGSFLFSRDLESIRRSGKIYVGMTESDMDNLNYPLAVEFAKFLNVELIIVEMAWEEAFMKNGSIPDGVESNPAIIYNPDIFKKVDIICSTFTILEWRKKLFDFAETLRSAELLLMDKGIPPVTDFSMLAGKKIAFMRNTSFEINLNRINKDMAEGIRLVPTETTEASKDSLRLGMVDGIILDADEALLFNAQNDQKYNITLPISEMTRTAWSVMKGNNLKKEVEDFFMTIESNGVLDNIFKEKFGIAYSSYIEKINKIQKKYHRDLDEILEDGKLVVALRDRKYVYKEGGEKQPMHILAEEFASYLGVSLEYVVTSEFNKYWKNDKDTVIHDADYTPQWFNYFDLACDLFTPLPWRSRKINFVTVYSSDVSVVAMKDKEIRNIQDLRELTCVTSKGSSYEDFLVRNNLKKYYSTADSFLIHVQNGQADFTIIDNAFSELASYPQLESKISLESTDICWGLRKDQPKLEAELRKFMNQSQKNGIISVLLKAMTLPSPEVYIHSYFEKFQPGQFPYILYGSQDGLPQEDIYTIFQDRKGYIWFGTNTGAVRYNGIDMKTVETFKVLGDNSVTDINQDTSGIIYLATSKGIAVYDKDTIIDKLFTNSSFHTIYIDKSNCKWFIGSDGIYILRDDLKQDKLNREFTRLPKFIYSIDEDPKTGDKYIATSEGVYYYSSELKEMSRLTGDECYSVYICSNDSIWISTRKGLFIVDMEDLKMGGFESESRNLNPLLNPENSIISEIIRDKYGYIWLVSDSKIMQVFSTDLPAKVYDQKIGLKKNRILCTLIDKEDNIWVGFNGGLQRYSNKRGLRNFYPDIINSYVSAISQDRSGHLWIASNNGVFCYNNKLINFTPSLDLQNQKFVMGKLPDGDLLFASSKGFYEVDPEKPAVIRKRMFSQMLLNLENVFVSSKGEIVLLTGIEGTMYYFAGFYSSPLIIKERLSSNLFSLIEKDGRILGGNINGLVELKNDSLRSIAQIDCKVWSLYSEKNILWIGTDCGLKSVVNEDYNNIRPIPIGSDLVIKSICPAKNRNYLWLGTNHGFAYFNKGSYELEFIIDSRDGLSGDEITPSGLFIGDNDILWVGTYRGLSNFSNRVKSSILYSPSCYLERILMNDRIIPIIEDSSFRYYQNNFVFEVSAISFNDEKSTEFEFYLRGTGNKYSSYQRGRENKAYFSNLPPGSYEFIYKAKGKNDIWSYAQKHTFSIRKAWYNTWIFRLALLSTIVFLLWLFYIIRIRRIQAQKEKLEKLVKLRTKELEDANTEIEAQRDFVARQRDQIAEQKKDIVDSIHYAEKIQRSLMPPLNLLKIILPEHFILFKPRDIVSGDFYWVTEKDDKIYVTAVDCTGHGVPGAFMSMLGISFFNDIVKKSEEIGPDEILNRLRDTIIKALKQRSQEGELRDGMDISFIIYDKNKKILSFAGANNPLYLIRSGELQEIKGDRMPVGIYDNMRPFTRHNIDILNGDTCYLFSDGYADQFGGPLSKKYMYSNFKKLLLSVQDKSMKEQQKILDETIEAWRGNNSQIDDMVVIGLRFNFN